MMRDFDEPPVWKVLLVVIGIIVACGLVGLGMVLFLPRPSWAADSGLYDPQRMNEQDQVIWRWFQEQAVRSCCAEADAFEADDFERKDGHYVAVITNGEANKWRAGLPNGFRILVPDSQIRWSPRNPTGHGVIFIRAGWNANDPASIFVYCYFPPGGV